MKPSTRAIVWNDWPALASGIGIIMVWLILSGYHWLMRGGAKELTLGAFAIVITLLLFAVLAWRVSRVYALFARGMELPATITSIYLVRDRGRLEFAYQAKGFVASSWIPVHRTKRVLEFEVGQPVRALVDPSNPKHAIVKELFLRHSTQVSTRAR